ncbi:MAG: hypothetical protein ABIA02_01410 [Candidatus Falkowbacteria bacterium]
MKKSNIIAGGAAMVAIIAVAGIAFSSFAADDSTVQKCERCNKPGMQFSEGKMTEMKASMEAKKEAMNTALENNDYNAWVEAVGEDCPMLEKINADNFSRFVEAHNLQEQARAIMEELGIEKQGFKNHMQRGFMHK